MLSPIYLSRFLISDVHRDYPLFYTRLYTFLDRDVLHLKHRARYFRLTELFLSSTYAVIIRILWKYLTRLRVRHLPAALLASFVKKLSRLSLTAPPAAIVIIVPFVYNILKRHPALMVMIHRVDDVEDACTGIHFSTETLSPSA
jgi:U3 small nucleolar RNA-associated protein 19